MRISGITIDSSKNITGVTNIVAEAIDPDYVIYSDQKTQGTSGGSNATGWNTGVLNTAQFEKNTSGSFSALSSNQFSLIAGRYYIEAHVPVYRLSRAKSLLYNVSDSANVVVGVSTYALGDPGYGTVQAITSLYGEIDISATKTFEIRQYAESVATTYGFGVEANVSGYQEIYTVVIIKRLGD